MYPAVRDYGLTRDQGWKGRANGSTLGPSDNDEEISAIDQMVELVVNSTLDSANRKGVISKREA